MSVEIYKGRCRALSSGNRIRENALGRTCLMLISCMLGLAGLSFAQQQSLSAPSKSAAFPAAFSTSRSFPKLSRGYLVSFARTIKFDNPGNILVTSLATGQDWQVPFEVTDGSVVMLFDGAMTNDDHLLLAGVKFNADGPSSFVSELDLTGAVISTANLETYLPTRVCATADGTFWTLGQTVESQAGSTLLRRYTRGGTLMQSYLPANASMPSLLPPGTTFGQEGTNASLACADDAVGAYVGIPLNTWAQVQASTGVMQQVTLRPMTKSRMTGLAVLGPGNVYASFHSREEQKARLYRLTLSSTGEAAWSPVQDASGTFTVLLGADKQKELVYMRRATGNSTLHWSDPQAPVQASTLRRPSSETATGNLGLPLLTSTQQDVMHTIGVLHPLGVPQCPPGSNGPLTPQCLGCQSGAHNIELACLGAASASELAGVTACLQKPQAQQKACLATVSAVYAAAVTVCVVTYNNNMNNCAIGPCKCPIGCCNASIGCP